MHAVFPARCDANLGVITVTTSRIRVLIEHEDPAVRAAQAATLGEAGFDVLTCAGPRAQPGGVCPLVPNGHCEAAEGADVIVNELPLNQVPVYVAQRTNLPDCPVVLGVSAADRQRAPRVVGLADTMARDAGGEELVAAVREAVDGR